MNNKDEFDFSLDFIGIGAPKCGTEWIVNCIKAHPEIDFSIHKEINYFLSPTKGLTNFVYKNVRIDNIDEYRRQFDWDNNLIKGVYNNHYVFDSKALLKIKSTFPDAKIILAVRDPVSYLYSIFWYLKYSNAYYLLPDTFEEAIENAHKDDLFDKSHGKFGALYKNVINIFGKENICLIFLDDIKLNPNDTVKRLYEFLSVDNAFVPDCINKRVNPTTSLKFPLFMKLTNTLFKLMERFGFGLVINYLLNTDNSIRSIYKKIMHSNKRYPKINSETSRRLKQYYINDIELLEKLSGRDLSDWKI